MKITSLTLYCSQLQAQYNFYHQLLGVPVVLQTAEALVLQVGYTQLRFQYQAHAVPYHFAINIPFAQIGAAHQWLRKRTTLLQDEHGELIDFHNWNAWALYAYDPAGNIVEWIARKDILETGHEPFAADAFIGISEIGVVTEGIAPVYQALNELHPLPLYDGSFDSFCAAGDAQGLFILIDKRKKKWFPIHEEAFMGDFIIDGDYHFKYEQGAVVLL